MARPTLYLIGLTLLLLIVSISAGSPDLELIDLNKYPLATCLDGKTPGGRYVDVVDTAESAHKLLIAFEGGGWVHTQEESYARSKTALGSSTSWAKQQNFDGMGIWSSDCAKSPELCKFTRAYLKYCDGTSFGGTNSFKIHDTLITHHGDYIARAHFRELFLEMRERMIKHKSTSIPEIIISGCSAGGLASVVNTWKITLMAREILGTQRVIVGTAPCSGVFLDQNNVLDEPVYQTFLDAAYNLARPLYSPSNDKTHPCFSSQVQPGKCLFAQTHLSMTQSPFFLLNSVTDSWSMQCIYASTYPLNCAKAGEWGQCSGNLSNCTPEQVAQIQNTWVDNFLTAVQVHETETVEVNQQNITKQPHSNFYSYVDPETQRVFIGAAPTSQLISLPPLSGAFLSTCWTHCDDASGRAFTVQINGTTSAVAIGKWWQYVVDSNKPNNTQIQSQAGDHFYLPCTFNTVAPFQCNPTCPP